MSTDNWAEGAKCASIPKNMFFPDDGPGADRAAAFCWGVSDERECPIRLRCLQHAIEENETLGVWGGYGQRDRVRIRREWARTGSVSDLPTVKVKIRPPRLTLVEVPTRATIKAACNGTKRRVG